MQWWDCRTALKNSLEKNDLIMKHVLWRKQCSGGCGRAELEARSSWNETREHGRVGEESWAQAAAEVLAGKTFRCGLSRPGHEGMLLWKAFLRPSAPFPVFKTRAKESGELCRQITTRPSSVCWHHGCSLPRHRRPSGFLHSVILGCK